MGGIAQQALLMAKSIPPVIKTFEGISTQFAFTSTWTYPATLAGAPLPGRLVVATIVWEAAATVVNLTGCTIGGVTASFITKSIATPSFGNSVGAAMAYAVVPTGTTVNVVPTFSSNALGYVGVYTLNDLISPTPIDQFTLAQNTIPNSFFDVALAAQTGGEVIGGCMFAASSTGYSSSGMVQDSGFIFNTNFYNFTASEDIAANNPAYPIHIAITGGAASAFIGCFNFLSWR